MKLSVKSCGVSFLLLVVGYLLAYPELFGWCLDNDSICISKFSKNFGEPVFFMSLSLLVVSVVLVFFTDTLFRIWMKFAFGYLIFFAILITMLPTACQSWLFSCLTKENGTFLAGGLFVFLSLLIIIISSIRNRRKTT